MTDGKPIPEPAPAAAAQPRKRPGPTIDLTATEIAAGAASAAGARDSQPAASRRILDACMPHARAAFARMAALPGMAWTHAGAALAGVFGALLLVGLLALAGLVGRPGGEADGARIASLEGLLRELAARPQSAPAPVAPQRAAPNQGALDALAARLASVEADLVAAAKATPDAALTQRLARGEAAVKTLGDKVVALERQGADGAGALRDLTQRAELLSAGAGELARGLAEQRQRADANARALAEVTRNAADRQQEAAGERGDIERLGVRIAGLERAVKEVAQEAGRRDGGAHERATRFAIFATLLKAAVERGGPFVAELSAVRSLGGKATSTENCRPPERCGNRDSDTAAPSNDAAALATLAPLAPTGVATPAILAREMSALLPALRRASLPTPDGANLLDRVSGAAARFVRVTPVAEAPSPGAQAAIARIEGLLAGGDIDAAAREIERLPAPVRAVAKDLAERVARRAAAIAAANQVLDEALAALAKPSP